MNECEKYREMISAMLDGELDAAEGERLVAHMSVCAECRELYGLLSSVSGTDAWELPEVPEGLHERIMSGVKAAAAERKKRARVTRLRPLAVAAACLVVIVGVVFGVPRAFRMGGNASGAPAMFNTAVSASGNAAPADSCAPAACDSAGIDTTVMEAPAENNAAQDVPADAADGEYGYTSSSAIGGGTPESAPVPEPEAAPEEALAGLDIDRSVVTVESGGKSVSERLGRYDTLLWLRAVIEDSDGGGFDAARLEIFRRGGADYEVYFYHDGGRLMGSLSEELEDAVELEELADFAKLEELADNSK